MAGAPLMQVMQAFQGREAPTTDYSVDLTPPWSVEDGIIEEFEFDLPLASKFFTNKAVCSACILPCIWPCLPCAVPCMRANNVDIVYGLWVAVSPENIYIVRRRRKASCRCHCCDEGEVRKVIPIANVQDVMLTGPAGTAVCCFVQNVLHTVEVQTAAAGGQSGGGETGANQGSVGTLIGLKDPKRFRDVVLALRREARGGAVMPRQGGGAPDQQTMVQMLDTNKQILETLKRIEQNCGRRGGA
mmetsp:Transcript_55251/g.121086  ORF Transcript_55251/g.121086 Transcript_55251/m.121086 type:complete len:244 (+) Transcript_55251:42-773(+)